MFKQPCPLLLAGQVLLRGLLRSTPAFRAVGGVCVCEEQCEIGVGGHAASSGVCDLTAGERSCGPWAGSVARRCGLWSPGWIWVWLEGGGPTATKTGLWPRGEGDLSQQGGSVCTGSVLQRRAGTSAASGSEKGLGPPGHRPSSFHSPKIRHDLL